MASRQNLFPTYSAFFAALLLYFAIVFAIFYGQGKFAEIKKYTDTKDAFMDVFVVSKELSQTITAPKIEDKKNDEPTPKQDELKNEVKTTNKTVINDEIKTSKKVKLNELFGDIKLDELKIEKTSDAVQSNKKKR